MRNVCHVYMPSIKFKKGDCQLSSPLKLGKAKTTFLPAPLAAFCTDLREKSFFLLMFRHHFALNKLNRDCQRVKDRYFIHQDPIWDLKVSLIFVRFIL